MEDLTKYYNSDAESAMDLDVPLMFLSFPSAKDPNWKLHPGRENKSTMALVTISKWEWFNQWKVKNFVDPAMFSLKHWAYLIASYKFENKKAKSKYCQSIKFFNGRTNRSSAVGTIMTPSRKPWLIP